MQFYGCRKVKVFTGVTEAVIDLHGSYGYIEVTNNGADDVSLLVNDFPEQGHRGTAIPIKAGTTRTLPLVVYKFQATDEIDVVAYGL